MRERDRLELPSESRRAAREIDAIVDSLFPDISELSPEEVEEMLVEGGCDLAKLRRRARAMGENIVERLRSQGKPVPPYLKSFLLSMETEP